MDKRTETTQKSIKNALLRLLGKSEYVTLSVSELCRTAGINRSTFYLHYHNMDEVLDALLEDAIRDAGGPFDEIDPETGSCLRPLCRFIRGKSRTRVLFLDDSITDYVTNRLVSNYPDDYFASLSRASGFTEQEISRLIWFQLHGCISVTKHNLRKSDGDWEAVKDTIDAFVCRGLMKGEDRA